MWYWRLKINKIHQDFVCIRYSPIYNINWNLTRGFNWHRMILQAIRALVHKIRRRSTGEAIYETPATIPFPPEDETRDSNLSLHSFGSMMDIDEEGELTSPHFSDLEGGSGMSPDYIEDWGTILARQQQLQQLQNQRLKQDGGLESGGTSSRPGGESLLCTVQLNIHWKGIRIA